MASDQIVLFDLASRPPRSTWSLNPWKSNSPARLDHRQEPVQDELTRSYHVARLLLNYKGLNYRTEWLEYPEIAPRLRDQSACPSPPLPLSFVA